MADASPFGKRLWHERLSGNRCLLALLTVAFESAAGITGGSTITEILAAYNPSTGNLWVLVLATTLLSPVLLKMFKQI